MLAVADRGSGSAGDRQDALEQREGLASVIA